MFSLSGYKSAFQRQKKNDKYTLNFGFDDNETYIFRTPCFIKIKDVLIRMRCVSVWYYNIYIFFFIKLDA